MAEACAVRGVRAGHESIPAVVAKVEHSYDAHRREAAARLLAEGLAIGTLVARSVDELDAATHVRILRLPIRII